MALNRVHADGTRVAKADGAMKINKRYLSDEEMVRNLQDTPWERGVRETGTSNLKWWLCTGLVSRSQSVTS